MIERLVAVAEADECDIVARLKVQAKPKDARLADKNADLAVLKVDRSLALVIVAIGAADLNGAVNGGSQRLGFIVKITPDQPLITAGVGQCRCRINAQLQR